MLKEEYKRFLEDVEKNLKNKEDLEYIKKRFSEFLDVILEKMENIMHYKEERMEEIEQTQLQLERKIDEMQKIIDNIEKDIYSEDFDFEIICPYCNYEFVIDVDENKTEIECPECNNLIELDWSGDLDEHEDGCHGNCSHCSGCDDEEQENEDDM